MRFVFVTRFNLTSYGTSLRQPCTTFVTLSKIKVECHFRHLVDVNWMVLMGSIVMCITSGYVASNKSFSFLPFSLIILLKEIS